MRVTQGIIYAYNILPDKNFHKLGWNEIEEWFANRTGILWIHLDYTDTKAVRWLIEKSNLNQVIVENLLTEETRPRVSKIDEEWLIILRGINHNPGSEPEDMVTVRLAIDSQVVISTQKRNLRSVQDMSILIEQNKGPSQTGELLVELLDRMVWRMEETIDEMEETISNIEDKILLENEYIFRNMLADIRRQAIILKRYMAPEKEALTRLLLEQIDWLTKEDLIKLREVSEALVRNIEDLDTVRERATVTYEELISHLSDQLNKRIYLLSLIAAIFLPLTFLTGLFGTNIGGIPGATSNNAFSIFTLGMGVFLVLEIMLFKWKKWM